MAKNIVRDLTLSPACTIGGLPLGSMFRYPGRQEVYLFGLDEGSETYYRATQLSTGVVFKILPNKFNTAIERVYRIEIEAQSE